MLYKIFDGWRFQNWGHTSICMWAISLACDKAMRASICSFACFVKKSHSLSSLLNVSFSCCCNCCCCKVNVVAVLLLFIFELFEQLTESGLPWYGCNCWLSVVDDVWPPLYGKTPICDFDLDNFGQVSESELWLSVSDDNSVMRVKSGKESIL